MSSTLSFDPRNIFQATIRPVITDGPRPGSLFFLSQESVRHEMPDLADPQFLIDCDGHHGYPLLVGSDKYEPFRHIIPDATFIADTVTVIGTLDWFPVFHRTLRFLSQ